MKLIVHLVLSLSVLSSVMCLSYYFGEKTKNTQMINREKVEYYAVPWKKRVEYYIYNDSLQRPIKAIDCHDYQRTETTVNITEGGIGFPFVVMRIKTPSSYGIDYAIEIFA